MRIKKDKDKKELLKVLDTGTLKSTKSLKKEMKIAKDAASDYLKKNARINIRLSQPDLTLLKRRAAEQGVPYQTLISSVLHQFVTGRISSTMTS